MQKLIHWAAITLLAAASYGCYASTDLSDADRDEPYTADGTAVHASPLAVNAANEPTGGEVINYQGSPKLALRHGKGLLLIEGDIQVRQEDIGDRTRLVDADGTRLFPRDPREVRDVSSDGVAVSRSELRSALRAGDTNGDGRADFTANGNAFRWPFSTVTRTYVIPFRFGTYNNLAAGGTLTGTFSAGQQGAIQQAITDWTFALPGVQFRAAVLPGQPNADANFITFNLSNVCSSAVGTSAGDAEMTNLSPTTMPPGPLPLAGEQIIRIAPGCIGTDNNGDGDFLDPRELSFAIHHEIAHALGILHEATRPDRNTAVTINWQNVRGCNATATGPTIAQGCGVCTNLAAGPLPAPATCGCVPGDIVVTGPPGNQRIARNTCDLFWNYDNIGICTAGFLGPADLNGDGDTLDPGERRDLNGDGDLNDTGESTPATIGCDRSIIGFYDLESMMHYPNTGFLKAGLPAGSVTFTPVNPLPAGVVAGTATTWTRRDIDAARAIYPYIGIHQTFFAGTGTRDMCFLYGRETDRFATGLFPWAGAPNNQLPTPVPTTFGPGQLRTDTTAPGRYQMGCSALSSYLASTYALPNTTVNRNVNAQQETYDMAATQPVTVLSRGLIPVLTGRR